MIKNSRTQAAHCEIPKGFMNPNKEDKLKIAKKFKWVDNQRIKVVNNEGMEKVLDISQGFVEKAYGTVPLFDMKVIDQCNHYYYDQEQHKLNLTKARLAKKY